MVNCDCVDDVNGDLVPAVLSVSRCNTAGCTSSTLTQAGPPDQLGLCTITYTVCAHSRTEVCSLLVVQCQQIAPGSLI